MKLCLRYFNKILLNKFNKTAFKIACAKKNLEIKKLLMNCKNIDLKA